VIGQRLQVGAIGTTIVGVTPKGFTGIFDPAPAVYIPITLYAGSNASKEDRETYYQRYYWGWMETMMRRKPGVSVERASADLTQAFRRSWVIQRQQEGDAVNLARANPNGIVGPVKAAAGPGAAQTSKTALWVTGVALIVLLIACANVANLSLARAYRRQREVAVRLALGVSRKRLMGQMLIESLLLAVLGGLAGVLVAQWGTVAIQHMLVTSQDAARPAVTDWRMLGIVAGLVLGSGLLAGLAPALLSGRGDLAPKLRGGARGGVAHRSRLRAGLLIMQGALSAVLLIGATLFVRSLQHVRHFRLGFDAENVFVVTGNLRGYALDSTSRFALQRDLLARAQATPGVASAAIVNSIPLWSTSSTSLFVSGIDSVEKLGRFTYQVASTDFFKTIGTRVLRGRPFLASDAQGSSLVMVVSEGMARVLWPGEDALGKCVHIQKASAPCTTVVGVAEDLVQQSDQLTDQKRFAYYLPLAQSPSSGRYVRLMVKMKPEAATQSEFLRRSLQSVMPGPSYVTLRPMDEAVGSLQRSWRLGANLFTLFGVLALIVAAVGLYGVIAYNVSQRMHELGVRVALGAQAKDILSLIVGQGTRFALAGVVTGSVLAFFASRWVQPLLFQQSARDPVVFALVGAIMLLVAIAACASPARRAAAADPNAALRAE
jgi:predicted permease